MHFCTGFNKVYQDLLVSTVETSQTIPFCQACQALLTPHAIDKILFREIIAIASSLVASNL